MVSLGVTGVKFMLEASLGEWFTKVGTSTEAACKLYEKPYMSSARFPTCVM